MNIPAGKKVVCITGTVWTGDDDAPRHLLIKDGFVRPTWFTTRVGITDAEYERIGSSEFHLARAHDKVLLHIQYASDFVGIMKAQFLSAIEESSVGVLVVGSQDIAAKLSQEVPETTIFALKDKDMELSPHLKTAKGKGRLHRINVDARDIGAWQEVHKNMLEILDMD